MNKLRIIFGSGLTVDSAVAPGMSDASVEVLCGSVRVELLDVDEALTLHVNDRLMVGLTYIAPCLSNSPLH